MTAPCHPAIERKIIDNKYRNIINVELHYSRNYRAKNLVKRNQYYFFVLLLLLKFKFVSLLEDSVTRYCTMLKHNTARYRVSPILGSLM